MHTEGMKNTAGARKTYSLDAGLSAKRYTLVFLPLTSSSVVNCKKGGRNNSGELPFQQVARVMCSLEWEVVFSSLG